MGVCNNIIYLFYLVYLFCVDFIYRLITMVFFLFIKKTHTALQPHMYIHIDTHIIK